MWGIWSVCRKHKRSTNQQNKPQLNLIKTSSRRHSVSLIWEKATRAHILSVWNKTRNFRSVAIYSTAWFSQTASYWTEMCGPISQQNCTNYYKLQTESPHAEASKKNRCKLGRSFWNVISRWETLRSGNISDHAFMIYLSRNHWNN